MYYFAIVEDGTTIGHQYGTSPDDALERFCNRMEWNIDQCILHLDAAVIPSLSEYNYIPSTWLVLSR